MEKSQKKRDRRRRAQMRVRNQGVLGTGDRPRLAVYKSLRYVYAQVIDDSTGSTLAQANSREDNVRSGLGKGTGTKEAARKVGELIAERAKEKGVEAVVFDRSGYVYHGRVREVAEGARAKGLVF